MPTQRKAAITPDQMLDVEFGKLTASDLITCLNHPEVRAANLGPIIADKKKFELWIDETPIVKITVRELIDRMRLEKKKVELEVPYGFEHVVNPGTFGVLVDQVAETLRSRGFDG